MKEKAVDEKITKEKAAERKTLEKMNLMDDFLMNQMIAHPMYGVRFSRKILKIILDRQIGRLMVIPQRAYPGDDTDLHGIRLDVYLDEEGSGIMDLEPDNNDGEREKNVLPKRVRFYHAKIDAGCFASGMDYEALRDVTVIFITSYDPFGLNRMVYTITNQCKEVPEMPYDDGAKSIFLYTKGTAGNCPEELKKLLNYMEHSSYENAVTEELLEIHHMVTEVKHDKEVGLAYMKSYEIKHQMIEAGRKIGLEEGIKIGQEEIAEKDARIAELEAALEKIRKGM